MQTRDFSRVWFQNEGCLCNFHDPNGFYLHNYLTSVLLLHPEADSFGLSMCETTWASPVRLVRTVLGKGYVFIPSVTHR